MGKSNGNGYVPRGLRKNKVYHAKHVLASADRTMTPQYHDTLGRSPRTAKVDLTEAHIRRLDGAMVLSPRQQRKRARLIELANTQARNLALLDRQKAAERATINAERGALEAARRDKARAKRDAMVTAEVKRRVAHENMSWFVAELGRMGLAD